MTSTYKIVFLGNMAVGKTTIISQYLHRRVEDPSPTIGVDYVLVNRELDGKTVSLQIWDTAGQEKFNSLISNYTRDTFLAIIVFAVDDAKSVEKVEAWINDFVLLQNRREDTHLMVVGNKIDLGETVNVKKGKEIAARVGAKFVQASGLSQEGIENLREAINEVVKEDIVRDATREENRNQIMVRTRPNRRCGCW